MQKGRRPATRFVVVAVRQFGRDPLEPRNTGALFFTLAAALYAKRGRHMDTLQRFPLVWCPICEKTQKMIFDVLRAGGNNDHEAADIICDHCKSIVATLHAPSAQQARARPKRAAKAREMAGQTLDRLIAPSATDEERQSRKRRLNRNAEPRTFAGARLHESNKGDGLIVARGGVA